MVVSGRPVARFRLTEPVSVQTLPLITYPLGQYGWRAFLNVAIGRSLGPGVPRYVDEFEKYHASGLSCQGHRRVRYALGRVLLSARFAFALPRLPLRPCLYPQTSYSSTATYQHCMPTVLDCSVVL